MPVTSRHVVLGVGIVATIVSLAACGAVEDQVVTPTGPISPSTAAKTSAVPSTSADTERINAEFAAALADFRGGRSGQFCGYLSTTDGTIRISAWGTGLVAKLRERSPLALDSINVDVQFGSFATDTCSDIPEENPVHRVDATWLASVGSALFTVSETPWCVSATLELSDLSVLSPDGERIWIGDLRITNPEFATWPPGECQLWLGES